MDRKLVVVPVIGLALAFRNIGDGCVAIPQIDHNYYLDLPHPVNMSCYVSSFNPEHPEQSSGYQNHITSMDNITASGTVSGISLSTLDIKYE